MSELVNRAKDLASRAHSGQVDKAGRPYVEHLARVAAMVRGDDEAEALAWLHDLLEDCWHTEVVDELRTDFPQHIIDACRTLDRGRFVHLEAYYADVRSSPLALKVKLADVADNADESRLELLDPETAARLRRKYQKAMRALTDDSMTPSAREGE